MMTSRVRIGFLPLGGILDRYLTQGFLRVLAITLLWNTSRFVLVEFFEIVGSLIATDVSMWTIA